MLEYTTTVVTANEATTATAARWVHCTGLIVHAHTELTLRLPKSKAGALAVLARLTAAVEALPDDTHAGQGVLTCPTCEGSRSVGEPGYTYYGIPEPGSFEACPDCMDAHGIPTGTAPVWRTLTFGDLRAGDVVKLDEDGDEETVNTSEDDGWGWWLATSQRCGHYYEEDPVLVRHPRPEVGQ